jgi:hypothetical protein
MNSRSILSTIWAVLALLGAFAARRDAGFPIELLDWEGEAVLISGQGRGPDLFVLEVGADWAPGARRDAAGYAIRVTLPDGRTETQAFPVEGVGRRRFAVNLPAEAFRNRLPSAVQARVEVVDAVTGAAVSNALLARIDQFPRPRGDASLADPGPFGWGKPIEAGEVLPNPGPDGFVFSRIPASEGAPGFFASTTEATVAQVSARLPGYDPKSNRSDEFGLEEPGQPAVNLTAKQALDYLGHLSRAEGLGIPYRLPTRVAWLRLAKGGKASAFWWGDGPTFPEGANFLGAEPALAVDTTAPSRPARTPPAFVSNPFGLFHTFGNAAEWAVEPAAGYVRMGGTFRTEPTSPLPSVTVGSGDELGPDAFVGVRPVAEVSRELGTNLARKRLAGDVRLARVEPVYDPDRATITLTGPVPDAATRREADRRFEGLWWVAAVDDRLAPPTVAPGQLATLGAAVGPTRAGASVARPYFEVPVAVHWLDPLPVAGSDWWVNIDFAGGGHAAHRLIEGVPARKNQVAVRLDSAPTGPFSVALSLGGPATMPGQANVVSNVATVRPYRGGTPSSGFRPE